jgi:hypothetical protein
MRYTDSKAKNTKGAATRSAQTQAGRQPVRKRRGTKNNSKPGHATDAATVKVARTCRALSAIRNSRLSSNQVPKPPAC